MSNYNSLVFDGMNSVDSDKTNTKYNILYKSSFIPFALKNILQVTMDFINKELYKLY